MRWRRRCGRIPFRRCARKRCAGKESRELNMNRFAHASSMLSRPLAGSLLVAPGPPPFFGGLRSAPFQAAHVAQALLPVLPSHRCHSEASLLGGGAPPLSLLPLLALSARWCLPGGTERRVLMPGFS